MAQEREDFSNIPDNRSEQLSILEHLPPELCPPAQIGSGQPSVGAPGFKRSAENKGERRPLEVFLRPISGLDLPGQAHLERYVHYKHLLNRKPATLQNTVQAGKLFLGFLNERGCSELKQVSRGDLEGFLEHEQDRGLKPREYDKLEQDEALLKTQLDQIQRAKKPIREVLQNEGLLEKRKRNGRGKNNKGCV